MTDDARRVLVSALLVAALGTAPVATVGAYDPGSVPGDGVAPSTNGIPDVSVEDGANATGGTNDTSGGDRFEPNDAAGGAAEVSPGRYSNLSMTAGDRDVFAVRLTAGERLAASTRTPGPGADFRLAVGADDDSNGTIESDELLATNDSARGNESVSVEATANATVYVIVSADDPTTPANYTLDVIVNDRFERNDEFGAAAPVDPGTYRNLRLADDESDVYATNLSVGDVMTVEARGEAPVWTGVVEVWYDADEDGRIGSGEDDDGDDTTASDERLGRETPPFLSSVTSATVRAPENGTHYVRVRGEDTETGSVLVRSYDLSIAVDENDAFEPNDGVDDAPVLSPGYHPGLRLVDGENDFYAVELGENQTLTARVTDDGSPPNLLVAARHDTDGDDDAERLDFRNDSAFAESLTVIGDGAGTYYVQVSTDGTGSTDYDLSIEVSNATRFREFEESRIDEESYTKILDDSALTGIDLPGSSIISPVANADIGRSDGSSFARLDLEAGADGGAGVTSAATGVDVGVVCTVPRSRPYTVTSEYWLRGEASQKTGAAGVGATRIAVQSTIEVYDLTTGRLLRNETRTEYDKVRPDLENSIVVTAIEQVLKALGISGIGPLLTLADVIAPPETDTVTNAHDYLSVTFDAERGHRYLLTHRTRAIAVYVVGGEAFSGKAEATLFTDVNGIAIDGEESCDATPIRDDETAPNVSITREPADDPLPSSVSEVNLTASTADGNGSGVASVRAYFDGANVTDRASVSAGRVRFTATNLTGGRHNVTVVAIDRAGNVRTRTHLFSVGTGTACIEDAVSGEDGTVGLAEIQAAIDWWAADTPVPDTGGETISLPEIQSLIDAWAEGDPIDCGG